MTDLRYYVLTFSHWPEVMAFRALTAADAREFANASEFSTPWRRLKGMYYLEDCPPEIARAARQKIESDAYTRKMGSLEEWPDPLAPRT